MIGATTTNTFLLEGLRQNDNSAIWDEFVQRYQPLLVKYAAKLGIFGADAEDAAQQTVIAFAHAYQNGKYDRERGRLRSWLFGIAHNQICAFHRKRAGREVHVDNVNDSTTFLATVPGRNELEELWEQEWREAVLEQCLVEVRRHVTPKTMEAFELFVWKEWPASKVASHLDMGEHAVYLAKHRVLRRIREFLPKMEEVW